MEFRCLTKVGLVRRRNNVERLYVVCVVAEILHSESPARELYRYQTVSFSGVCGKSLRETIWYDGIALEKACSIARKLAADKVNKDGYQIIEDDAIIAQYLSGIRIF